MCITFGVDNSSSVHIDNKKIYSSSWWRTKTRIRWGFGNSRGKIFYVTKIYNFKAKDSEIKPYPLPLGNISKDFAANGTKKPRLNGYLFDFSVDYNIIHSSNVINSHKYLMKKQNIK